MIQINSSLDFILVLLALFAAIVTIKIAIEFWQGYTVKFWRMIELIFWIAVQLLVLMYFKLV